MLATPVARPLLDPSSRMTSHVRVVTISRSFAFLATRVPGTVPGLRIQNTVFYLFFCLREG